MTVNLCDLTQSQFDKLKLINSNHRMIIDVYYDKRGIEYWVAHKHYQEVPYMNRYKIAKIQEYKK